MLCAARRQILVDYFFGFDAVITIGSVKTIMVVVGIVICL